MPVDAEELLRLARKAWPSVGARVRQESGAWLAEDDDTIVLWHPDPARFHAALLVLAGECVEIDVEALQKRIENSDETLRIALAVATCAGAWDPEARLIGNVRAVELLTLAQAFVGLHEQNAALQSEMDRHRAHIARLRDVSFHCGGDNTQVAKLIEEEP